MASPFDEARIGPNWKNCRKTNVPARAGACRETVAVVIDPFKSNPKLPIAIRFTGSFAIRIGMPKSEKFAGARLTPKVPCPPGKPPTTLMLPVDAL